MAQVLHLTGPVLVGPQDERRQAWVVGGRITYVAPSGDHDVTTVPGWVLPGLVDAHSHIGLGAHGAVDDATAQEQALADRDAGALLLRDAGSPADTRWVQARHDLPRLVRAGRHIARTRRYIRNFAWEVEPEQLVEQVRLEARAGDGWVKLVGDWIDRDLGDLAPAWAPAEMAAAVAAAHAAGVRVASHLFAEESVAALVRAGVDSVEHGTGLSDVDIAEMAARGTALVPTMINIARFGEIAAQAEERFPGYARHMVALRDKFPTVVGAAYDAGVPIYVGSDAGGGIDHGMAAEEMLSLHANAGLSTMDVLGAGSWGAREWLGFPGLVEGGLADCVVYDTDPRIDLTALRRPRLIMLRGRVRS